MQQIYEYLIDEGFMCGEWIRASVFSTQKISAKEFQILTQIAIANIGDGICSCSTICRELARIDDRLTLSTNTVSIGFDKKTNTIDYVHDDINR